MKRSSIEKKTLIGLIVSFTAVLAFAILVFFNMKELFSDTEKLKNSSRVMARGEELYAQVLQFETVFRGILFTDNEVFLQKYDSSMTKVERAADLFIKTASHDPESLNDAKEVNDLIRPKLLMAKQIVRIRKEVSTEAAIAYAHTYKNEALMRQIESLSQSIYGRWEEQVRHTNETRLKKTQTCIILFLILMIIILFIFSLIYYLLRMDLVGRKTAEISLKKALYDILDLYDNAPCGYHSVNNKGIICDINLTELKWLGYTREEVVGKMQAQDLLLQLRDPAFQKMQYEAIARDHNIKNLSMDAIRKDGSTFPVILSASAIMDEDGKFLRSRATLFDSTELQQVHDKLVNHTYIVNNAQDAIIATDLHFCITHWNKASEQLFGQKEQDVIGKPIENTLKVQWVSSEREEIKRALKDENGWQGEAICLTPAGTSQPILASCSFIRDESGNMRGFLSIMRDISERKKAEEALQKMNEDLEKRVAERTSMLQDINMELIKEVSDRKRAEHRLMTANEQLRNLSAHQQSVREEERTRIAREVHDQLGQQLTGLKMDIAQCQKKINEGKNVSGKIEDMMFLVDETIQTVRKISTDLRPGILDDLGLEATIEWQAGEFQKRTGINCLVNSSLKETTLGSDLTTTVFRIFQETLTNIVRHAQAKKVEIDLSRTNGTLHFQIKDDGVGFNENENEIGSKNTLGVLGMKERASIMGGELLINSKPGKGTIVKLSLPINKQHA